MSERVVFHSDLNNCYASIECMLHPELKGKYIAVCGSTEERHGIVLAKNQLAKKCGVKTGDVIWEAKQKCPQLTIVPPHMDEYLKFSRIVRSIYADLAVELPEVGRRERERTLAVAGRAWGRAHFGQGKDLIKGNEQRKDKQSSW